ncbi:MAG: hypothetical protein HYW25_01865 [Candidatus Aenigmarchaeota archaeon]|nr:hypothetical protein [Candidatus Aenigmarchaeota archaeon]
MKGQVFVAGAFMIALVLVLFAVSLSTNLAETEAPYKGYLAESIANGGTLQGLSC